MIHCFEALQSDRKSFDSERDFKARIANHLIQNGTSEQDRGMFLSPPGMKIIQQRQGCINQRGGNPPHPPANCTLHISIYTVPSTNIGTLGKYEQRRL